MNRPEIVQEYYRLEAQLEDVARSVGKTADQLTANYLQESSEIKKTVRPILRQQLEYLDEIRSWHFQELGNVIVFPSRQRITK